MRLPAFMTRDVSKTLVDPLISPLQYATVYDQGTKNNNQLKNLCIIGVMCDNRMYDDNKLKFEICVDDNQTIMVI